MKQLHYSKGRISSNDLGLGDSLIEKHKQLNKDYTFYAKLQFKLLMWEEKSTVIDSTPIAPFNCFSKEGLHLKFQKKFQ
ncbi:MAG: hypothetical protein R2837_08675 [Aliarcobacter sp.]